MSAKHTLGPWIVTDDMGTHIIRGANELLKCGDVQYEWSDYVASTWGGHHEANAHLIAAAPDYHDATFWILQAVTANAAPVNPMAALEEMALDGEHITLDAGLVLDLLKAHAKATGGAV